MELRFLRDTDKREVDFVVLQNKKPLFAVECKTGDRVISSSAKYFSSHTTIPKFYQVHFGDRHYETGKIEVIPFISFCNKLQLP